jgi:uncharacterized protein YjbJ (UPF0337 family)
LKDFKDKLDNAKDKVEGKIKETFGKISGNEQLELKGKLQTSRADLKKKTNLKHLVNEAKEGFAGKVNDMMDKKEKQ